MSSFPYPQVTWTAVVGADRAYYDHVQALTGPEGAAVAFPSYCAERRFQLVGNQMRIGRRSVTRGLAPEIDLTGPPADPGISRLHAVLIATPDGNWAVLDPGSANGTLVNGTEIGTDDQVALHDGDRINLGAWTAITVHRGLGNFSTGSRASSCNDGLPRH
jgi:pSer/pThr/pTyr-binding forkhead associated (FHA) protein